MIQGTTKTEANYRDIYLDSSSSLKDFSMDKRKYYKKHILNEVVEEKPNIAINTGRIVETLLLEEDLFHSKFYVSTVTEIPTALMLNFVECLYDATRKYTDEKTKQITKSFEFLTREAHENSGYKLGYETVIGKFIDGPAQDYYDEIRAVRANNLTVVSTSEVENSQRIVEELTTNFVTSKIVNIETNKRYTVLNQFQIEDYVVFEHRFKSMIDKIIIDHDKKTIEIYDLKCTWSVDNFYKEYYLYRRSYIQAYLYFEACKQYFKNDDELKFYEIVPTKFIVCDSINYMNPLIYVLSYNDIIDCELGFEAVGKKYPGVKELIDELKWSLKNNMWNIYKKQYESNGVINIKE